MEENKTMVTMLTKVNDTYFPMIEQQLDGKGIKLDGYSKQCILSALSAINAVLDTKGISWADAQLDRSNITQTLMDIACLKLNASASPREVYFQLRNVKTTRRDENGQSKDIWKKQIEMGIEGDGNDAILANFGRDVKKVGQYWLVRENDHFEYPKYNGLEMEPPKWTPTGKGEVVRVVYPITKTDGQVEFYIGERDDVARNLIAHINNNLMNETFGICKDRYKATDAERKQIAAKKTEILKKAKELGLDALDDPDLQDWISPAWTEYQSREQMIIRKIRNNIVKKIPKNFGNAYIEMTYWENDDKTIAETNRQISQYANSEVIDITDAVTIVEKPAAAEEPKAPPANEKTPEPEKDLPATGTEGPGF